VVGEDGTLPLPWLGASLQDALRLRRSHALLLHGPQGVGQWELALTLAQALLCEAGSSAGAPPCGRCASCRLVRAHSHPDLMVLLPEALREPLGWTTGEGDADAATDKVTKTKPSKEIKVEAVRAAVAFAQTTSARGRVKVLVVHPAERMNGIAANTLLKTLEEPPGDARFVLGCAAPDALLPTIRSRCQALPLGLPPRDIGLAWLTERGVVRPEVMLAAAGGQPQDALEWAALGVDGEAWLRLPRAVAAGQAAAVSGWPLPRLVDALQKLCHDLMSVACGAGPRYFPEAALPAAPGLAALAEWAGVLHLAARQAEHPWNAGLMAESLVQRGKQALESGRPPRSGSRGPSVHSAR
jgi:DNA polymerase III subunit delta'